MSITPLPEPPSRADSANFAQRGDAFMTALPSLVTEANTLAADVSAKQATASAAATTATEQAGIATDAADAAGNSAGVANTKAGEASTSAAAALTSKNAAGTSATNAAGSETAAAASAASVDAQSYSTDYAGPTEPTIKWPYMTWADTTNMTKKERDASNTYWTVVAPLLMPMAWKQWLYRAIGEPFPLRDDLAGVIVPPTSSPLFRFIKLTATDAYNSGILISETVTGSFPLVIATAAINYPDSPLHGETVNLINTERRFLRAGASGQVADDMVQDHLHVAHFSTTPGSSGATISSGVSATSGGALTGGATSAAGIPLRAGIENRPKNQGATYYMRII